ncbi:hypothetical protein FRC18_005501 [Serendipita sp. 400]|nr:hypothetical protein FRC18_005501 [Serendipita sp. 400]
MLESCCFHCLDTVTVKLEEDEGKWRRPFTAFWNQFIKTQANNIPAIMKLTVLTANLFSAIALTVAAPTQKQIHLQNLLTREARTEHLVARPWDGIRLKPGDHGTTIGGSAFSTTFADNVGTL